MTQNFKKYLNWNVYQIYPRSFCDSNGDGIGDLPGIVSKLEYLRELGIHAIWLCPCYKSPNVDNGYDVSDYRDIMDELGTLDDMKRLISELHRRGMKLIMDLVPNHTSNRHKWFTESRKSKNNPYSDYYYWADEPKNDWTACFGGSAWQYDESRKQYYLHSYAVEQPDLNWENPQVVKEFQDIIDFWVELGVDGFRIDVIDQISKDWENGINGFGPHLHEYIHAMFGREKTKALFTVGECWCEEPEEICRHCKESRHELVTLFQFDHFGVGRRGRWQRVPYRYEELRDIVLKWQTFTARQHIVQALFTDNHDQNYFLSRVGNDTDHRYECATLFAALFYLLKGTVFLYQGQEFGSVGSHFERIEDFDDIESINYYKEHKNNADQTEEARMESINFGSRDNARRPMAWNNEKYNGFSTGKPWIANASRSDEINLENDRNSEKSVYRFYRELLALRNRSETLRQGGFKILHAKEAPFFMYERSGNGERYVVIGNFDRPSTIPLPDGEIVLSNRPKDKQSCPQFGPYETVVYRCT